MSPEERDFRKTRRIPSSGMLEEIRLENSGAASNPKPIKGPRASSVPIPRSSEPTMRHSPSSPQLHSPVVLNAYKSEQELLGLGQDRIKAELKRRGLQCNGTLEEMAQRLWSVRGLNPADYPKHIIADRK